jgi:uncharacterized protein YecE (DUF72 family)
MIYIGTSGFSYEDWVGPYYPADLDKREWLSFYAREFSTSEINFTYYRIPAAKTLAQMANKTPEGFLFTIKATQELTHVRDQDSRGLFTQFKNALKPLIDQGKFGCVLAQFPHSFHNTPENIDYLKTFRERMGDLPLVIEFRGHDWLTDEVFAFLRQHDLGFCCVDEPKLKGLMPSIAEVTGPVGYVRFHGRNVKKWWQHEEAWERYDYTYSEAELQEWGPKIEKVAAGAEKTFAFANNHWQAQAIGTARQLKMLLGEKAK